MNIHTIALVAAVVSGALGQLFMKQAMQSLGSPDADWSVALISQQYSGIAYLTTGITLYLGSVFLWILALKKYDLSYAYPILASGYVLVYLGAALPPLSETLTTEKTLGILLILIGVSLSSQQTLAAKNISVRQ